HPGALEYVDRSGRQDLNALLRQTLYAFQLRVAHEQIGLTVHANHCGHGVNLPGPMPWPVRIELITKGPGREIRVMGYQRNSRRAQGGLRLDPGCNADRRQDWN